MTQEEAVRTLYTVAQRWQDNPPRKGRELHDGEAYAVVQAGLIGWAIAQKLYEEMQDG